VLLQRNIAPAEAFSDQKDERILSTAGVIEAAQFVSPDVECALPQREFREARILRNVVTRSGIRPKIVSRGERVACGPMPPRHQPQGGLGDQQRRRNPKLTRAPFCRMRFIAGPSSPPLPGFDQCRVRSLPPGTQKAKRRRIQHRGGLRA